jgi:hypothetical protein
MPPADDHQIPEALAGARRGLAPGPGDVERVWRRLEVALRAPTPTPASAAPSARLGWHHWMGRLALAGALTGAGAAVGYWAGRRVERREIAAAHPPAPAAPIAAPGAPAVPAPREEPAPVRPIGDAHRSDRHRHGAPASAPADDAESLAAEVRGLRNVERALRERNPGLAMAFLEGLDREIPGGQMREERAALRAIARCSSGDQPFGVDLATDFAQAFPASAYQTRVEQACERTDPGEDGDSSGRR